jgi:hypothetical protein
MPITVTKTSEFEQILKVMTGLQFSPYDDQGHDIRARIIACPDADQQAALASVFSAIKEAFDMAECIDNVRAAIKRTETHYQVIADDVEDHFKLLRRCIFILRTVQIILNGEQEHISHLWQEMDRAVDEWARLRAHDDLLKVEELESEIAAEVKD